MVGIKIAVAGHLFQYVLIRILYPGCPAVMLHGGKVL